MVNKLSRLTNSILILLFSPAGSTRPTDLLAINNNSLPIDALAG